jgi:universal stress protein E
MLFFQYGQLQVIAPINLEHDTHPALDKARFWAELFGGELHLITSVYDSIAQYSEFLTVDMYREVEQNILAQQEHKLDAVYQAVKEGTRPVYKHVRWSNNIAELLSEFAQGHQPGLIIKRCSEDDSSFNPFATATDRHCIRTQVCPLLLTKDSKAEYRQIVVAINPCDKEDELYHHNQDIIAQAQAIGDILDANVRYVHFYAEPIDVAGLAIGALTHEDLLASVREHHEEKMQVLAQKWDLANTECILTHHAVEVAIEAYCVAHECDLLILGTAGRQNMDAFLLGNTAEDVIQHVNCDVMTIPRRNRNAKAVEESVEYASIPA